MVEIGADAVDGERGGEPGGVAGAGGGGRERQEAMPRTAVEELLAGIWAEVLGREQVGVEDDFFRAGGHSLLATQVISRVRQTFHADVPLRDIFEAPGLRSFAARIEKARQQEVAVGAPPLLPALRTGPLPLSFAQQRLWVIDQLHPGTAVYNVPAALRLRGLLQARVLERSPWGNCPASRGFAYAVRFARWCA